MADTDHPDVQDDEPSELRKAADRGRAAQAEAEALKRELAFAKAGIDTDTKAGKMLLRSYEGELTADAIKAEAEEIGLFKPQQTAPVTETATAEEREQTELRAGLATGSAATATPDEDPQEAGLRAGFEAKKMGANPADSFARGFGEAFLITQKKHGTGR